MLPMLYSYQKSGTKVNSIQPPRGLCCANHIQALGLALGLMTVFLIWQWIAAVHTQSLSLLADAGHGLIDELALVLSLVTTWWGECRDMERAVLLPISPERISLETLSALVNSLTLVGVSLWIGWESVGRWQHPALMLDGWLILLTAMMGIVVNTVNIYWLKGSRNYNLNMRGVFLHILADLLISFGVVLAAVAITWLHWLWMDSAIGILIAGLILAMGLPQVAQVLRLITTPTLKINMVKTRPDP